VSALVSYAELEIELSEGGRRGKYRVRVEFRDPRDNAGHAPALGKASIERNKLRELESDPRGYGRALASGLFATREVAELYDRAKVAAGKGGQLRGFKTGFMRRRGIRG
jgi:hypothetical protein